jgi:hypothetical protein
MNKKEKRYILSDVLLNKGAHQVSSFLQQRKVLKYVKENLIDQDHLIRYESKILNSTDKILDEIYEAITANPSITLAELMPDVIKVNKRSYAR